MTTVGQRSWALWAARLTVRRKIVIVTCAFTALVGFILTLAFFLQMRTEMTEELRVRARTVGIELSNNMAFATLSGDKVGLQTAAASTLRDIPDAALVVFRDSSGQVLASVFHAELKGATAAQVHIPELPENARTVDGEATLAGEPVLLVTAPILIEAKANAAADAAIDPTLLGDTAPAPQAGTGQEAKRSQVGLIQVGFGQEGLQAKLSRITSRAVALGFLVIVGCAVMSFVFARVLTVPLERLSQAAAYIANGDLRQHIDERGEDEIAELGRSFSTMSTGLRTMVSDLQAAARDLQREAGVILSTASQQAAMASQQASTINETSTTAAEIAQTSQQATEYADTVIAVTEKSTTLSEEGQKAVEDSVAGIEKLGDQVRAIALSITELSERTLQIGDIISTVKDLAEQSNMLALNASIEAAKTGEHGRGFAVVAMEMRNLAEQSKVAAGQVRKILGEVQKGTSSAVAATEEGSRRASAAITLAERAGQTITALATVSRESSLAARQIANNTRQQTLGVKQIVSAITEQSRGMAEAVEGTRQIERVAESLSTLSKRFDEVVMRYRTDDDTPSAAPPRVASSGAEGSGTASVAPTPVGAT